MDSQHFDNLARALARRSSRRSLLAGLGGAIAAGLTGARVTDAAPRSTRQSNGAACTRATDCASLKCVDGVCCNSSCTGQCESCATGTCLPVSGVPVGSRPPCGGSGVCQATCDGVQRTSCTQYPGLDVPCKPTECNHGWLTTYHCGGDGTCHPTTTGCGRYGCDASGMACATACSSDDQCDDSDACTIDSCGGGQCVHTPLVCDDGIDCTIDSCDPETGCVFIPIDGFCDERSCQIATCVPNVGCVYEARVCDDGIACTHDFCDPRFGSCFSVPVDDRCSNDDLCQIPICSEYIGCTTEPKFCDDFYACTVDTCVDGTCIHTPNDELCPQDPPAPCFVPECDPLKYTSNGCGYRSLCNSSHPDCRGTDNCICSVSHQGCFPSGPM